MHFAQRPSKIIRDRGSITRMESIAVPLVLEDGHFEIKHISPGDYTIKIIAPNYQPIILRDIKIKSPAANNLGTVELLEGSGIAGRILSELDQIPLADYSLRLRSEDNKSRVEKTGSDGRFQFMGLQKGIYSLHSLSPDHINFELNNIEYNGEKLLDLGDLILKQGGTISGKVSLMDGSPLNNVRVSARELIDKQPQIQHAMTDAEGNFQITALKSAQYHVSCEYVEDGKRNYDALEVDLSCKSRPPSNSSSNKTHPSKFKSPFPAASASNRWKNASAAISPASIMFTRHPTPSIIKPSKPPAIFSSQFNARRIHYFFQRLRPLRQSFLQTCQNRNPRARRKQNHLQPDRPNRARDHREFRNKRTDPR